MYITPHWFIKSLKVWSLSFNFSFYTLLEGKALLHTFTRASPILRPAEKKSDWDATYTPSFWTKLGDAENFLPSLNPANSKTFSKDQYHRVPLSLASSCIGSKF
jgi:hypothetical protein